MMFICLSVETGAVCYSAVCMLWECCETEASDLVAFYHLLTVSCAKWGQPWLFHWKTRFGFLWRFLLHSVTLGLLCIFWYNDNMSAFMVLSSWHSRCESSSWQVPTLDTKPTNLGCETAAAVYTDHHHLLLLLNLPSCRLSWPRWLATHPSTNWARCRVTTLIETISLICCSFQLGIN